MGHCIPSVKNDDYWSFINQVRRDWNVNFTIDGPWDFFHVQRKKDLIDNPELLKAYLKRKNLRIVALTPWLGHDDFNLETRKITTKAEYKAMMSNAITAFRKADPNTFVTGCIESFVVPLSLEDTKRIVDILPPEQKIQGYHFISPEILKVTNDLQG